MKWKKHGKIFNPFLHQLPEGGSGFAQSPQALVLEDGVRIYFSTRQKEEGGKFLSKVAFVDLENDLRTIRRVSDQPVIELGALGTFDEHGIFPFSPFRHGGAVYAYTCGWSRRISVSVETSTGFALSNDNGNTFKKMGTGPVMGPSLHEPFLVGDSFVRSFNGAFHMWYIFGTRWITDPASGNRERVYKIAHARSADGVNWERDSKPIIADAIGTDECQALPSVLFAHGKYHMVFCYRHATGFRDDRERGYRLGYAWSTDMINWMRADKELGLSFSDDNWDDEMQCYPHIFECRGKVYLLYNGNGFGREGFGLAELENWK